MVNSYHQKTFAILKSNIMSKLNVKILLCKQNIWKGNYKFDDDLLSEEHLDNTDNDNDDDDGSSSDNEEMKKMKPIVIAKMLFFAFYSNQYMTTTKIKIR